MTILGTDISNFQAGLNLARLTDASFVIAKTTEGTYYTDASYQGWRQQAAVLGKPFVWYHFLSGESAAAQAAHTAANVGDRSLPGMLDVEVEGTFRPTLAQVLAYIDAAHAVGLNLRLVYLPRWYWAEIGSPDLSGLAARGVSLVSSAYPSNSPGTPAGLYPGDGAAGWQAYGGMTPLIYQFTSVARDGGQELDYNAYRGTQAQLVADLNDTTPSPGGTNVASNIIPASIAHHFPGLDLTPDFPANASFDEATADIWADARAEAAWRYGLANSQKLDQLLARPAAAGSVNVNALAAQLGPLLHPTTDVNALAAALAPHVGAPDAVAFAAALAPHIKIEAQ